MSSAPGGAAAAADQSAAAGAAGGSAGVGVLDAFLAVQARRAAAYHRLDEGFRAYLRTGAEGPFRYGWGS